jgi:hypothetical protein
MTTIVFLYLILGDKDLRRISPKSARILALCGDHSNYTFEQAGYNTAGREFTIHDFVYWSRDKMSGHRGCWHD